MPERLHPDQTLLLPDEGPLEHHLLAQGLTLICGVDEAGRGPLAGPVIAAALLYRDVELLWQARDSKAMTAAAREEYYERAVQEFEYGVGLASPAEIDGLNILRASLVAMERAVAALPHQPSVILVDGIYRLHTGVSSHAIAGGDARVAVISAASIIAKVTRDRLMCDYDREYPGYGFARHFGYPTAEHRRSLSQIGPCPIHRRSFHGVREFFEPDIQGQSRSEQSRG